MAESVRGVAGVVTAFVSIEPAFVMGGARDTMNRHRRLILVVSVAIVGAAFLLGLKRPRVATDAPPRVANRADDPGDLYILAVGVEPRLTAKGERDPYAGDAWFVRQALAGTEPFHATTHSRVLAGRHATRAAVLQSLTWLGTSVTERDLAVIFFSTHGDIAPRGSGAPKDGYYIDLAGAGISADVDSCVLWGSELNATLAAIRGRAVLLLDTCHAGGVLQAGGVTSHRVAVIAACAAGEISDGQRATADQPHGWFVIALCEALGGLADANQDGVVTLAEVASYVPARSHQLFPKQNAIVYPREALLDPPLARINPSRPASVMWPPAPHSPVGKP
jgi:hypothetical protein